MLQWLIDLLTPVFTDMGVSPTDVETYVNDLGGYIYAMLGTLLLAIAVMVGTHFFAKKGTRHVVRWAAGISWVLVVAVLANVICFGPMYNNLSSILNYQGELTEESMQNSTGVIEEVGREGTVLLKNDGLLPLDTTDAINVFGWDSTNPVYGGSGSGATDESKATSMLQAFADAGFETNEVLTQMYRDYMEARPGTAIGGADLTLPEPTADHYTDELMAEAKEFSDVAVITIGRPGGEGFDLPEDMNAVINGTYSLRDTVANGNQQYTYTNFTYTNNGDYDDFDEGEHYLQLSNTEEAMVERVCSEFDNVVVVINANNAMELGWVDDYEQIGAVLLIPGTGANGFTGLAEVMKGTVNPSGRTVDTYAYELEDQPTFNNIANFSYNNVDDLKEAFTAADMTYQGNIAFVNYVENIYLGYRYFETAAEEGVFDYEDMVQYPFGYGLSYTTFSQEMQNFTDSGDTVSFDVNVTNTGAVAGKEVVEVYFTPPYNNGGIEKASVNLIEFAKTDVLEPGASQTVHFEIAKEDMASYDSNGIKTENGGYILEAGDYNISIRANSHDILDSADFTVDADIDYSQNGRTNDGTPATNQFQDYSAGRVTYLSREDHFANLEEALAAPSEELYVMDDETRESVMATSVAYYNSEDYDVEGNVMPTTGADNGLELAQLRGAGYDDPMWEDLLDQLSIEDMFLMVNLGGFQTVEIESVGKVQTLDSDGPAGLNDWYIGVYGTSFPTAVLIAQTWNTELAQRVGSAIGAEYADCDIYGW